MGVRVSRRCGDLPFVLEGRSFLNMFLPRAYRLRARRNFKFCSTSLAATKIPCATRMKWSLRNFSIFRNRRHVLRQLVISVIAGISCSFWAPSACALDPGRTMSQYMSDQLGSDRGFPAGSVTAITQTRDGYLWIGTDKGLIRFDCSVFHQFPQATPTTFSIGAVQELVVDGEG